MAMQQHRQSRKSRVITVAVATVAVSVVSNMRHLRSIRTLCSPQSLLSHEWRFSLGLRRSSHVTRAAATARPLDEMLRLVQERKNAKSEGQGTAPSVITSSPDVPEASSPSRLGRTMSPEEAVKALINAAGPGAGVPPPEVVGAALKAMGIAPTEEAITRALRAAGLVSGVSVPPEMIATALAAATMGLPNEIGAGPAVAASPTFRSPEEVVQYLKQSLGTSDVIPPDVIGRTLREMGVEITTANVLRALREAAGPGGEKPSSEALGAALKAAMATASGIPNVAAAPRAVPTGLSMQSPEDVVRTLRSMVGEAAGLPPPEVLGAALRVAGLPATEDNLRRALVEANAQGVEPSAADIASARAGYDVGPQELAASPAQSSPKLSVNPSPEEVIFALRQAAGAGAGRPPPEVVGVALRQAGVTPLSAEAIIRALKEAGDISPSAESIQAALQAASTGILPNSMQ